MALHIGEQAPDFTAETTEGTLHFHDWIGNGWAILFSHPKDFTPVCTTELGYMARLKGEFAKRNCKVIGLSIDPVTDHKKWAKDIEETQGYPVSYPIIGDHDLKPLLLSHENKLRKQLCKLYVSGQHLPTAIFDG